MPVADLLDCTICAQPFGEQRRPRTLACGHTFCSQCIFRMSERCRDGSQTIECPICKSKFTDIDNLPINYQLLDVAEAARLEREGGRREGIENVNDNSIDNVNTTNAEAKHANGPRADKGSTTAAEEEDDLKKWKAANQPSTSYGTRVTDAPDNEQGPSSSTSSTQGEDDSFWNGMLLAGAGFVLGVIVNSFFSSAKSAMCESKEEKEKKKKEEEKDK